MRRRPATQATTTANCAKQPLADAQQSYLASLKDHLCDMGSLTFTADSIQDLSGKVVIITGGNSGLVGGCCCLRPLKLH
jgi:hypothetical protein